MNINECMYAQVAMKTTPKEEPGGNFIQIISWNTNGMRKIVSPHPFQNPDFVAKMQENINVGDNVMSRFRAWKLLKILRETWF